MKIDAATEVMQPQFQAGAMRDRADFQATLNAAQKKSAEASRSSPATQTKSDHKKAATSYRADVAYLADYVTKSPAQHMRDRIQQLREEILKKLGLSEEALAAMPANQREAIEKSIMAEIQKRLFEQADNAKKHQPDPINPIAVQADTRAVEPVSRMVRT